MVRLLHARHTGVVDAALAAAMDSRSPFMLLVYSDHCGHCVRMMPAFNEMLVTLGRSTPCDVVQLASDALHASSLGSPHPLRRLIQAQSSGVPYLAIVTPQAVGAKFIALPDTNARTAASLTTFARQHLGRGTLPRPKPATKPAAKPAAKPNAKVKAKVKLRSVTR